MSLHPLLTYRFGCNNDQQPFVAIDNDNNASLGSLQGLDQASCLYSSNGVRSATRFESTATISSLRDEFFQRNATGIVLEVWINPSTLSTGDDAESIPIFVIGNDNAMSEDAETTTNSGCPGVEVFLGIRGDVLEVQYSDDDEAESCRILVVRQQPLEINHLTQVVVSLSDDGDTSIYLDGNPVIQGARNDVLTNMSAWDPNSTLKLLSSNFDGTLHQVSLYSNSVTEAQVTAMYQRGLRDLEDNLHVNRYPLMLVAQSENNPAMIIQGQSNSFRVGGFNASKPLDYTVMVEIISLPQFGNLLSDTGPVSKVGHQLPLTGGAAPLFYRAWSKEYFNVPKLTHSGRELDTHPEFFSYRLIAVAHDNNDALLGWSEPIRQELAVVHINHPPSLVVPEEAHVPLEQPSALGARPSALIEGVELKDPLDWNIDRVRVDVWADSGTLTFHEDVLPLADFESCRQRRSSNWQCQGTGVANRNMTFLAEPDDVSQLLSNLEYTAFDWDQADNITIRIFDGSGGPCLSDQEHQETQFTATENFFAEENKDVFYTIHEECFGIETSIVVPGIPRIGDDSKGGKGFFTGLFELDSFSAADIVFWGILVGALCLVCFLMQSFIRCHLARGSKIYPEDNTNYGSSPPRGDTTV
jgi:hypothetical protein